MKKKYEEFTTEELAHFYFEDKYTSTKDKIKIGKILAKRSDKQLARTPLFKF